jgi:hypothetical protein
VLVARLLDVVVDCAHPGTLARFWAAVLDGYDVAPYDDEELARLRSLGVDDPVDDPSVLLETDGPGPRIWFQRVPEPKTVKNRLHLDLVAHDLDAEVARLVALGATALPDRPETDLVVLRDPEGNEFCVQRG